MSTNPDDSNDVMRRTQRRFNLLMSILLVMVGMLTSWYMFRALYPPEGPEPMYIPKVVRDVPKNVSALAQGNATLPPGGSYVIKLLPYPEQATGEQIRAPLAAAGIESTMRMEVHVQVGPLRSQQELDAARAKLKELGVFGGQVVIQKK